MVDRIKKLVKESGLNNGDFADKVGINRASLSHILSGRNKPSLDFVLKLLEAFPSLKSDWLLFGKGSEKSSEDYSEKEVDVVLNNAADANFGVEKKMNKKSSPEIPATTADSIPERIVFFYPDGKFKQYKP